MNTAVWEQARHELAAEILRSRGSFRLRVTGLSMLPTLWPGDIVTIDSCDLDHARRGDLVLYRREERFFVHRVIGTSADEEFLIARGDCIAQEDPPVCSAAFLGRVTQIERRGMAFAPKRKPGVFQQALAALCRRDLFRNLILWLRARWLGAEFAQAENPVGSGVQPAQYTGN
ncbi:MAG TPA: S24/S26 family peptidase [Terriglobales bacterium]|nr:S24/S26 family peptidase [Terriglobales bacterium]